MKYKESETVELKKSTAELKEAVIAIAAMLNKHGKGRVYFGIKNDGSIIGQDIGENTIREVSQTITDNIEPRIFPKITAQKIKGRGCITVVFSGSAMPYFAYGRAYMRVGDENKQLTVRELEKLILKKHKESIDWEKQYSNKKIYEINARVLRNYISRANTAGRINFKFDNTKNVLRKLGLLSGNKLLKAAEILFCNSNSLEIQAAVFAGIDKITFLDIKKFEGNIFELLKESEKYISERINWRVQFGKLEREEIPEVPVKAVREALVNSLCHRDYANPKGNEIAIFKDRIEIYNPGDFPEGYVPEDFIKGKERSILRNPLIAETVYKSKDIEKWGSGLKRIYDECKAVRVPVEFEVLKSGFLVVFRRKPEWAARKGEGVNEGVNEGVSSVIEYIRQNPGKRAPYIAQALNVPLKTLERWLKKIKFEGKIRYKGSAKTGGYYIKGSKVK
ncbi:transcriptional regulator [bacterium]|nr:transcriptional regulator [bacterium]